LPADAGRRQQRRFQAPRLPSNAELRPSRAPDLRLGTLDHA
jgi:hypothetical protein